MTVQLRSFFLSLTIIAVLLFSAIGTTTAYADDGTKTGTTTTDTTGESSTEEGTTDQTASAEAAGEGATDEASKEDPQPAATEVPAVASETTAEKTVLEQVPENTTVAVLDAEGQAQPLATASSADAIAVTSDPIWCPAGQSPTPGANGCTASFTSFDALLTELAGNAAYTGAGTIYVQQGAYAGGESTIDFNSYNLSNISTSDLTVQGGWNTSTNTVDPASSSTFNISLLIGSSANPWGGSVTLNNLGFNGTSGTGITVYSQGSINLDNVQSSASVTGSGAELNAGVDVNITDSTFDRNRESGAIITAGRDVTVVNSSFSNPTSARLQMTGLDITSGGFVTLLDVIADGNREVGANIVADGRVAINATFLGGSSFSGMRSTTTTSCPGSPSEFCGYGLNIVTLDSIDINNVVANDNFLWGGNFNAGIDVNISDSIFNGNSTAVPTFIDDTGIFITAGNDVNLTRVQANDNRLFGANIDAGGNVSINDSQFLNNTGITLSGTGASTFHGHGLWIISDGTIDFDGVTASNNMLSGAHLEAAGDVIISNSTFSNNTTGSATDALGVGLEIISGQNVFIGAFDGTTVTLDGNQLSGATIQAAGDVFLDFVTATNNGTNGVETNATCTSLNGGTYTGNGEYGLSLVNPVLSLAGSPVFSGNGLGDINPATTSPCPAPVFPVVGGGTTSGISTLTGSLFNRSMSLSMLTYSNKNLGLINSGALTLDNLFAGNYQLVGVSTSLNGNITALGIFTGKYAYVHSAQGLQIVFLTQPAIFSGVWSNES